MTAGKGEDMRCRAANESGIVLMVVLLVMLIFTVMMLGFYFVTTSEEKIEASDRDNAVAYYGAVGALEKMSSDLAAFFVSNTSPTPDQISALTGTAYQPTIPGITFPSGGYTIANLATPASAGPPATAACTPNTTSLCSIPGTIVGTTPLAGLQGIITPFLLTVIADGPNNTEVKMTRQVQEVAVPIFQYGIFSQTDLSFFAGPNFSFGGRTHTNGNLFLAEGAGDTLTLGDHTTAYLNIIRTQLSNGYTTATGSGYEGTVDQTTTAGGCPGSAPACQALAENQGSLVGGPGSAANPNWPTISLTTFNGYIQNGLTGAKNLNLALALAGATPIAMIERPLITPAESPTSTIGSARFFNQASLRILLSDTNAQGQLTGFVNSTSAAPYPLAEGTSSGMSNVIQRTSASSAYYLPPTDSLHPPIAQSPGWSSDNDYMLTAGTTLLGGYIKCEVQLASSPGTWQDVTQEILSLGISRDVMSGGMAAPTLSTSSSGSLSTNTTYYYTVTAVLSGGAETLGTQASKNTGSGKTIKVSWSSYSGATGYKVYRSTTSEVYTGTGNGYISVSGGSTTSYTDNGGTTPTSGSPPAGGTNISILHLEEARPGVSINSATAATTATNFVPINLYDSREGEVRDSNSYSTVALNGVMNIVEIDVHNLQKWFAGTLCSASTVPTSCPSGTLALTNAFGYIVYFSDRRGNNNAGSETGQYGYEDTINPSSGTGTPNGVLDAGEDVNGNGVLDTYGGIAHPINSANVDSSGSSKYPTGSSTTLTTFMSSLTTPSTPISAPLTRITATEGQKNPVLFFRRALRLVNGAAGNLPPLAAATCTAGASGGFTVVAENPVYVQGDYNATAANGFTDTTTACHVPAAVMGDAVTLLSDAWIPGAQAGDGDYNSFANPTNAGSRVGSTTYYRMAVMGGKNNSFPLPTFTSPAAPPNDFGTDGGTHNFLRYIENWGGQTLNYRGALASFYISVQATGVYKCCNTVYSPPSTRAYAFDTDFQSISKLPPGTPRFTDVNALSYQQAILATQ